MSIGESLQNVIGGFPEARGVALVGMDGILVEEQKTVGELDLQTLGAEFSGLVKSAEAAVESVNPGPSGELVMVSENATFIVKRVTPEYFLLLVSQPDGNMGKGRFLLKRAGERLKSEL